MYAQGTTVSAAKSRAEIEDTLTRYGASAFGYMTDNGQMMIGFKVKDRTIRMTIRVPDVSQMPKRTGHLAWKGHTDAQKETWVEQEYRRRWRALLLVIKAKLEAVQSGIALFEDEFLPYTVTATGETVAEVLRPQLNAAAAGSWMPQLPATQES